ncbi:MAG: hypothetical protein KIT84_35385 [Labilithrix sp.]|nr:hypothetical protein [Labilithrix sp.]MCW5816335.1 hypothetical protein [Labilithrix sp.]
MRWRGVVVVGAIALGGCRPLPAALRHSPYTVINGDPRVKEVPPEPTQAEWNDARAHFVALQREVPVRPYVERVRVAVLDPRSGKVVQARGAVAVHPGQAARMVLLGPGGTTALDLWITPDRWRVSIPAAHIERRGGRDLGDALGLPVGFVRWWFLAPIAGELLYTQSTAADERTLWFKNDGGVIELRANAERLLAIRRAEDGRVDGVEWLSPSPAPRPRRQARYIDAAIGVRVDVLIEDVSPDEPDPAAFLDPDEKGTPL